MHWRTGFVQWVCDFCGIGQVVQSDFDNLRPLGWEVKAVSGYGETGYTKLLDCCPQCNAQQVAVSSVVVTSVTTAAVLTG